MYWAYVIVEILLLSMFYYINFINLVFGYELSYYTSYDVIYYF